LIKDQCTRNSVVPSCYRLEEKLGSLDGADINYTKLFNSDFGSTCTCQWLKIRVELVRQVRHD